MKIFAEFFRDLRLWPNLAKNCMIRALEYKANLAGRFFVEIIWLFGQVVFFGTVFRHSPDLAGWKESEIWFFVGSLYVLDGLMMGLLYDNLTNFGDSLRSGIFDFYMLRPASVLFLSLFRFVNPI